MAVYGAEVIMVVEDQGVRILIMGHRVFKMLVKTFAREIGSLARQGRCIVVDEGS